MRKRMWYKDVRLKAFTMLLHPAQGRRITYFFFPKGLNKMFQIDNNFLTYDHQAELESEGIRSYKVPFCENKGTVELLLNVR